MGSGDGQFGNPVSVAVDTSGNVYVSEINRNQRIQKFSSTGSFLTKWGSAGSGDGQFSNPSAIAVDSSGNVYVGERGNQRIQKFSPLSEPTIVPTTLPIEQSPYITGPTTINAPGYYILQNDFLHEGPTFGIRITAPNVIFDGNSHTITGSGQIDQSMGILIDGAAKNVTVKNVQIKNSYFGIYANSPGESNHNIVDNIVTDCLTGIAIVGGNKNTLMRNTASNNTYAGILITENSHSNTLVNNVARDNGYRNFKFYSTDNILSGNIESRGVVTFTPTPTESTPIVTTVNPTLTGSPITTIAVPTITQMTTMTIPFTTMPTTVQMTTVPTTPTDSVQKLLEEQNRKIEEQNKKLADLNKTIAEQNQKLSEQNDILTQIINFLKSMFGWK